MYGGKKLVSSTKVRIMSLPEMPETWVWSLGWEDLLEEGMATHSSIPAWRIPMNRKAWQAIVHGVAKSQTRLGDQVQHSTKTMRGASLVAQMLKNLPAMQETWIQSLGWEDPLEKGMHTHSSILIWTIPWTEEPGRLQFMGSLRAGPDWVTKTFTFLGMIIHSLWTNCPCVYLSSSVFILPICQLPSLSSWLPHF